MGEMKNFIRTTLITLVISSAAHAADFANTVYKNGKIYTVNDV